MEPDAEIIDAEESVEIEDYPTEDKADDNTESAALSSDDGPLLTGETKQNRKSLSVRNLAARQREQKAIALRKAGATYDQIGGALGVAPLSAYRIVKRAIDRVIDLYKPDAEHVRALELERLDSMFFKVWSILNETGQEAATVLGAVDRLLKIQERRARYMGLDKELPPMFNLNLNMPGSSVNQSDRNMVLPVLKSATMSELGDMRTILMRIQERQADGTIIQARPIDAAQPADGVTVDRLGDSQAEPAHFRSPGLGGI